MPKIIFNGKIQTVRSKTLGGIIEELGGAYKQGSVVAVISGEEEKKLKNEFFLRTEKGEARIRILREKEAEAVFYGNYKKFRDERGRIGWKNEDIVAIGPIETNLSVEKTPHRYKKWDVFFGFGGFDPSTTYLMISKRDHEGMYGTGTEVVIGKLTKGRSIISELSEGDRVEEIGPIISKGERIGFVTSDLNTKVEEEQEIFTFAKIKLLREAPMSSEHFLSLTEKGVFHVDDHSSTYLASESLIGLNLPSENVDYRSKYCLSVRNEGKEKGKVYAYKESRLPHSSHNVFGRIIQGGELIDHTRVGDTVFVETEPTWMMAVGKKQKEAEDFFKTEKIQLIRGGNRDDDAIIVRQEPELTMVIMEGKRVKTYGVKEEEVLPVELFYDDAPKTVRYFKRVTGLIVKPIGELSVYFTFPGKMILFQGSADEAGTLIPENTPKGVIKKGMMGVTNMSKANRGLMGIRLDDSEEYGPTGEEFSGTNMVLSLPHFSKTVSDYLNKLKDGDVIHIKEKEERE